MCVAARKDVVTTMASEEVQPTSLVKEKNITSSPEPMDSSESEKKVMNQQQSLRDKVEEELPKVETSKRKQEDDAGLALDIKKQKHQTKFSGERSEHLPGTEKGNSDGTSPNLSECSHENPELIENLPVKSFDEENMPTQHELQNKSTNQENQDILKALVATSEEKEVKQALGQNDSDKENDGDAPMDLSKAVNTIKDVSELQPITGDDVIMLSDEDDDLSKFVNGFRNVSPDELKQTRKAIRKLQEDLRNEETKLVLLKKLRQSQLIATSLDGNSVPNKAAQPPSKVLNRPVSQQNPTPSRGNQQPAHAHVNKPQTVQQMQQRAQLNQSNHVSGNRVTSNRSNSAAPAHQTSNQAGQPGRQTSSAQVAAYRGSQQTVSKPTQPEQSPSQRQAAAKLALRKQLEKTLLQIPPPKPPPPEMNFIPSTASGDFIPLVGLEEVVKFIVEADARNKGGKVPEVKYVFNPFTCVQCGTDFTPVWKRDKPGSKNVICEQCVTSNQKKALKQEHTNRLKSAFVKALQQEQEIEQRMQQTEKTSQTNSASSGSTQTTTHTKPTSQSHQRSTPVTAHSHASSSSATSARSSGSSHSSGSSASSSSNYKAEQMRQHQNLLQVHQQQLRSLGLVNLQNFAPHLPFPYQPQLTAKQAADLQRQYLLDMIQPRSVPGGASIWRNK